MNITYIEEMKFKELIIGQYYRFRTPGVWRYAGYSEMFGKYAFQKYDIWGRKIEVVLGGLLIFQNKSELKSYLKNNPVTPMPKKEKAKFLLRGGELS